MKMLWRLSSAAGAAPFRRVYYLVSAEWVWALGSAIFAPVRRATHRDISIGTGACVSNVRVTPPNTISIERAWL
jgi:hypothetical protein